MGESSYLSPVSGSEILENSQTLWQIIGCVENIIHMQTDMWSQGMTCQAAIFTPSSLPPHLTLFLDWPGQEQEDLSCDINLYLDCCPLPRGRCVPCRIVKCSHPAYICPVNCQLSTLNRIKAKI